MPILRSRKDNKKELKYLGGHVPIHIVDYFSLLSVAKGISKSQILRKKLDDWYQSTRTLSDEELINIIVRKAIVAWRIVRVSQTVTRNTLLDFNDQLAAELRNKGVCEKHIESILIKFEREKDQRIDYETQRTDEEED